MTEPDVTLTDFALALLGIGFAWGLPDGGPARAELRRWLRVFFVSVALASALGGAVHGFFLDEASLGHRVLWPASLLAIGVTALSGAAVGARLLWGERGARRGLRAAWGLFALYVAVVLLFSQSFAVAIAGYVPAALLLLVAFLRAPGARIAAWGLALALLASAGQLAGVGLHPVWFNHNALYHLLQALALGLLFVGSRGLLSAPRAHGGVTC
jgi:hypothetical protein